MTLSAQSDDGELFGRYRLVERIGAGGMAVVYRALAKPGDPKSVVVVKRVLPELSRDPAFVKMLVAEARLSSRLIHPNIVRIHELGRVKDEYYLSMEHVDGVDLVRLLNGCVATRTLLPIDIACYIAQKVAEALAYAHALQDAEGRALEIVHRDVSPANIMVGADGQVKLLDFGVAKAAEHVRDDRTRTGTLKGKINYLSPEQAEGLAVDGRSDLFALGIVLHECLTLKRLFRGPSDLVTLRLVRQCEVTPPSHLRPDVPTDLDTIVLRMLARDRGQRFARGEEIAAALAPLAAAHGSAAARLAELMTRLPTAAVAAPAAESRDSDGDGDTEMLEIEIGGAPAALPVADAATADAAAPATADAAAVAAAAAAMADAAPAVEAASSSDEPTTSAAVAGMPRRRRFALVGSAALIAIASVAFVAVRRSPASHQPPPAIIASTAAPATPKPVAAPPPQPTAAKPPASSAARLTVELDVAAAQIWLDGALVGDGVRRARFAVDRPGQHLLRVIAPHRRAYRREIFVPAGADLELRVALAHGASPTSNFQKAKVRTTDGDYLVDPFKP